jgi:hypothetical protein
MCLVVFLPYGKKRPPFGDYRWCHTTGGNRHGRNRTPTALKHGVPLSGNIYGQLSSPSGAL